MRYFLTFRREDSRSSREGLVLGNTITKPGQTPIEWLLSMNHPERDGQPRPRDAHYTLLFWAEISEGDAWRFEEARGW